MSLLSDNVLKITIDYVGPSSKLFLERQTKSHMNGLAFDKLEREQLAELARWVGISATLLIDKDRAAELSQKIAKL